MKHYKDEWIKEWCKENGWTELFIERYNNYWAFPPGAVMPEPIPPQTLRLIKAQKGLSLAESIWLTIAISTTVIAIVSTYFLKSPMPIVLAFALNAIAVTSTEIED